MIILGAGAGGMQPSTPTIGTATAGDTNASVAFTASSYIGKGTITYTATSSPGGLTATGASSPLTVSGLTNGTAYTFTVVGTTNYGVASAASAASNSITPAASGSFESIATYTLTGNTSDITFSSIPQTFQHLQLRIIGKDTRNDSSVGNPLNYQFNNDTGASNYTFQYLYGSAGSANAGAAGSNNQIPAYSVSTTTAQANTFGAIITDILDYSNANKYKTVRSIGGLNNNGGNESVFFTQGMWKNNNAISTIKCFSEGQNLKEYSQIALYGIKGA